MSQGMTAILGDVFGTTKVAHTEEDFAKEANLRFFGDLCRENNINVDDLSDEQAETLFKVAMEMKQAKEEEKPPFPPKKEEKKDDGKDKEKEAAAAKLAAADAEYQEKRAAAIKVAEADYMGRVMAHSFVNELEQIRSQMEGNAKVAAGGFPFPPKKDDKKEEGKEDKGEKKEEGKDKEGSAARAASLISSFEQAKTAQQASASSTPNFDEVAANHAIDLLKEAGVEAEVAQQRVSAVYVLGMPESTKIASATKLEDAIHVRALEFCEAAGFQVNWG